ncbi:hypothetical protein TNCV_3128091 [Trichonephila clavipes]|nr:hypothetical protein TNCV_3128091 [Trichonephila clavipes]
MSGTVSRLQAAGLGSKPRTGQDLLSFSFIQWVDKSVPNLLESEAHGLSRQIDHLTEISTHAPKLPKSRILRWETATAGSDGVQSGRPIFDDFFQHLWPYIGINTANVVFQMVKRLWLIRIDQ